MWRRGDGGLKFETLRRAAASDARERRARARRLAGARQGGLHAMRLLGPCLGPPGQPPLRRVGAGAAAAGASASGDSSQPHPSASASDETASRASAARHALSQEQDSCYDGFCPEKSLYSTGSSDTSSVMSGASSGQETPSGVMSYTHTGDIYARTRPRPRPSPIYEKHGDYTVNGQYGTLAARGRATIAQATVVNLVKSPPPPDVPPPLPPRPLTIRDPPSGDMMSSTPHLPPMAAKPRSRVIMSGAISLPRRRDQFKEAARRRGSYHDTFKEKLSASDKSQEQQSSELFIEPEEKVRTLKQQKHSF